MADAIPTASCEVVGPEVDDAETTKEPVQLCLFAAPMTTVETFIRTTQYAEDPAAYLRDALGSDTFESRKQMLSLPGKVDMDRYGTGEHKQQFEQHIAKLLGKKHGLFFVTGVQAQLAALKIHAERAGKNQVAWHVSSHLESAEQRSFETLYGLKRYPLGSDPEALATVKEIKDVLSMAEEARPAAILIEIPNRVLGCKTYTFAELEDLSSACREAGVAFHMDGARLWEIEPYYQATAGKSFADLAALFDTVYVSFYKGLGGVAGAMLVSNDDSFIEEAKVWQRRAGGNAFTLCYEVVDDERGFNQNIGTFARKRDKMIAVAEAVTAATAKYTTAGGRPIVIFVPRKPTCCQVLTVFEGYTAEDLVQARDRVQERTNVQVFRMLRPKETHDETMKADREKVGANGNQTGLVDGKRHFMEWMIMSVTEKIEDRVFVEAYVDLCKELVGKTS